MNRYGPKARKEISSTLHEFSEGRLKSGKSGKKVTIRQQAISIGISRSQR